MGDHFDFLSSHADATFDRLGDVGFDSLTPSEQIFICVWSLSGEVDNGGFDQFFYNSSGDHALVTPAALRKIGAIATAEILEAAMRVFPGAHPSSDRDARIVQLDALPDDAHISFSDLEGHFYARPDDLDELLARYVRANPDDFLQKKKI